MTKKRTTIILEADALVVTDDSDALDSDTRATIRSLIAREDIEFRLLTQHAADSELIQRLHAQYEGSENWRVIERVEAKQAKFSKSSTNYWWKMDAFKTDIFARPIRRLIWIDADIFAHESEIDNWLDPYGVLEEDRLYLDYEPGSVIPSNAAQRILDFIDG